jgi:hypothetical protein
MDKGKKKYRSKSVVMLWEFEHKKTPLLGKGV